MREKNNQPLSEYEKKLIKFYIQCLISEGSKILIYFFFFHALGLTLPYLAALAFLAIFRVSGGGLHFKNYITCLIVSFLFLGSAVFLRNCYPEPVFLRYAAIWIYTILCCILVPIQAPTRPDATSLLIQKSKRRTLCCCMLLLVLIIIFPSNPYINIGYWTLMIHTVQLMIARSLILIHRR